MPLITPRLQFAASPVGADPTRPSTWWPAEILNRGNASQRAPRWSWSFPDGTLLDGTTQASVNHGRWMAGCPTCGTAQVVDPTDPRFWCMVCRPPGWRTITVPEEADDIERILMERAEPENRNWEPWETVDHLQAENDAGGPVTLGAPDGTHVIAPGTVLHPDSEWAA